VQVQPPVPGVVLKGPAAGFPTAHPLGAAKTASLPAAGTRQDDTTDLQPGQKPREGQVAVPQPVATPVPKPTGDEPAEPPQ